MMKLRNLYIRWKVWRGKALDIWSKSPYPANVLSNLCSNGFRFDGVLCGSMEGFLQSLKYQDMGKQRQICSMKGKNAKNMTSTHWQTDQIVWWKGSSINRQSKEFQNLIRRAYQAMFEQNERFRIALMSTRGIKLYHSQGEQNPYKTILTESEFCSVLTQMRDSYDINNNETPQRKKRLYFDMDGVLVDFESALAKQDEQTLKEYEDRLHCDGIKINDTHVMALYIFPKPRQVPEAAFGAVLINTTNNDAKYYTLEYSFDGAWVLGSMDQTTHRNYGSLENPGLKSFIDWVVEKAKVTGPIMSTTLPKEDEEETVS